MKSEKFISAYNKLGNSKWYLSDGSCIKCMEGIYDKRGLMSDCVEPRWAESGECLLKIIPVRETNDSHVAFTVHSDKDWGNRIIANIINNQFQTYKELTEALKNLGAKVETYTKTRLCEDVELYRKDIW